MAHEIETMAYANEVPWHGLGTPVSDDLTVEQMQTAAGLDWSVSKRPVMFSAPEPTLRTEFGSGLQIMAPFKDKFVLARDTDNTPYAVVSGRYKPVQPKQVLEFFRDLLAQQGMKLETAGSLRDGKRIWALAKTGDSHKVLGNDEIGSYLLLATSYDLTFSTLAQFTSVRVVCNNTLQQSLRDATGRVTIPHFQDFNADLVKDQLGIGRDGWSAFTSAIDVIAKARMTTGDAVAAMNKVFELEADPTKPDPNRVHATNVIDMFTKQEFIGADLAGRTGWGLLNCLTEYTDFKKRARGQGNRLDNAWFGDGAKLKERGLETILEMAA